MIRWIQNMLHRPRPAPLPPPLPSHEGELEATRRSVAASSTKHRQVVGRADRALLMFDEYEKTQKFLRGKGE